MTFRWRAHDDPTLNAGFVALCIFRGSGPVVLLYFCDFPGGGSGPPAPPPPLDPHMYNLQVAVRIK